MKEKRFMNDHVVTVVFRSSAGKNYIRCLTTMMCALLSIFFASGCTYVTCTGNIQKPNASAANIAMKYPYKFYISSMQCSYSMVNSFGTSVSKTAEIDRGQFTAEMRRIFAARYPQLFVATQNEIAIPIDCTIEKKVYNNFLSELAATPFSLISMCTLGLIPAMMNNSYSDVEVQVNAGITKHYYRHKLNVRNRLSIGPLGLLDTRKSLPDFSKSDTPPFDVEIISAFVLSLNVSPKCSDDFMKMFIYAINGLDHKKLQLLYNEKYRPKVDFILP